MTHSPSARRRRRILALVLLLALLLSVFAIARELEHSRSSLSLSHYSVCRQELTQPLRIILLSDLHNSRFGTKNEALLSCIGDQQPDLIFLAGDLVNADDPDLSTALSLVEGLCQIAPVYLSLGNHEVAHQQRFGVNLSHSFTEAGATVLNKTYEDVEIKGQRLRIGGVYGYCLPEKYLVTHEARQDECDFLHTFQDTDRTTLLLCHIPVAWLINDSLEAWDVDLVFSGHVHGGQVILPGIGGLYGPDLGWFPGRLEGLYPSSDGSSTLVLTRGLGSTEKIPRFNNPPEVVVMELSPAG